MRMRRLFGLVSGRMDTGLQDALRGQLRATTDGARVAAAMVDGSVSRAEARARMRRIEHRGDTCRADFVARLSSALVTPIDREDLFRLSRSIDDVLDTLRDFVRESHLYRVPEQRRLGPMLERVLAGVTALDAATRDLVEEPPRAARSALEARKAGGALRRLYQYEIARVLDGAMTTDTMKERELVRRLELVGQHICDSADAIMDGTMKRWH
ncbi:DUF47 domain-containing protein [Actinomadura rupiterrae]|uniref:DUF47 domain-containing protein n=1 Tax=Actinomadura rupiterrae TaxID=559627 RepID=UPI0020A37F4C|nr:DUF47 family protein [Actinomadura rupiterrae]MCP2334886.1 hypothetical protein [Actinomadura rupiterrae]